jgi:pimeloyl-ACP methyl ester carboxylesterase
MKRRRLARALSGCLLIGLFPIVSAGPASADNTRPPAMVCQRVTIKVAADPGAPRDLALTGTLCQPGLIQPTTVQLLVHGATYNQAVWDWPHEPDTYSYVRDAVTSGYATFAVDRIGHGGSDKPPSATVTIAAAATALHDVVGKLRAGEIGGRPFSRVVWVGHSLGAVIGYEYGGRFTDVDAYALTGSIHFMNRPGSGSSCPACNRPAVRTPDI